MKARGIICGRESKKMASDGDSETVQANVAELAVLETRKKGPGALWVSPDEEPVYRTLDQIEPARFRDHFRRTWEAAAAPGERVFMVVADKMQLHVVRVPVTAGAAADPGSAADADAAADAGTATDADAAAE